MPGYGARARAEPADLSQYLAKGDTRERGGRALIDLVETPGRVYRLS